MKKLIQTSFFLFLLVFASCSGSDKKSEEQNAKALENKSELYKEVVKNLTGDFSGFSIGASLKESLTKLDKQYLVNEEKDFLNFKLSGQNTTAEYNLLFENDKLVDIALDAVIYDNEDNYDPIQALLLFNELKEDFLKKFGSKYLETTDEDNSILFWTSANKEIQLIKDEAQIHVYIEEIKE